MRHDINVNIAFALACTTGMIVVSFLMAFLVSKQLSRKGSRWLGSSPLLIWLAVVLCLLVQYGKGYIYPLGYLFHSGKPEKVSAGQIEAVLPGPEQPIYYDPVSSSFTRGTCLVIQGNTYFYPGNSLRPGQWVKVEFIGQDRIICAWQALPQGAQEPPSYRDAPIHTEIIPDTEKKVTFAAGLLWYSSFGMALLIVLLQCLFRRQIAEYLFSQDSKFESGVHPSSIGWLVDATILPYAGMLLAQWHYGHRAAGFLLGAAILLLFPILLAKRTTHAVFSGNVLRVEKWKRSQVYTAEQIRSVQWRWTTLPFGRRLDIQFADGRAISFEQEHFWGLSNMHRKLSEAAEEQGQLH